MSEETTEMSYQDILDNLRMQGELVLTIPSEMEGSLKVGLKNLKAKQVKREKEAGTMVGEEFLEFNSTISKEFEDSVDLRITLKKKGAVTVKKLFIPDGEL